jgi:hypothetical protein
MVADGKGEKGGIQTWRLERQTWRLDCQMRGLDDEKGRRDGQK